jgi:hypothetical protein
MRTFRNLASLFCIIAFFASVNELKLHGFAMCVVFGLAAWGLNFTIKREAKQFIKR